MAPLRFAIGYYELRFQREVNNCGFSRVLYRLHFFFKITIKSTIWMLPNKETRWRRKSKQPNAKCTKNECTARWDIGESLIGALKAQLNQSTNISCPFRAEMRIPLCQLARGVRRIGNGKFDSLFQSTSFTYLPSRITYVPNSKVSHKSKSFISRTVR